MPVSATSTCSLTLATFVALHAGHAAHADCPAGVWNRVLDGSSGLNFNTLDIDLSISPGPAAFPTFTLGPDDIGTVFTHQPGDPGFYDFAAALTNGNDDTIWMTTSYPGAVTFSMTNESVAFGSQGSPDLHWTNVGEIRIVINDISFVSDAPDSPTFFHLDMSFEAIRACNPDTNADGQVDVADLVDVILGFGSCSPDTPCPADVTCDGIVDVEDLVEVILNWGGC
jgi:hypothetical protein